MTNQRYITTDVNKHLTQAQRETVFRAGVVMELKQELAVLFAFEKRIIKGETVKFSEKPRIYCDYHNEYINEILSLSECQKLIFLCQSEIKRIETAF